MAKTLKDLSPHPRNPRKITDKKLELLKKSLHKFGDLSGFLWNVRTNRLVGGHQRGKVLPPDAEIHSSPLREKSSVGTVSAGYVLIEGERFAYREVDWSEEFESAAMIAANQHGGDWDLKLLPDLILDLDHLNFDLDVLGFDHKEMADIMAPVRNSDNNESDDDVPEPPKIAKTKNGDIYQLGNHRLMCGDSSNIDHVRELLSNNLIDMVFTSPPYNVGIKYGGYDDEKPQDEYFSLMNQIIKNCYSVMSDGRILAWNVGVSPKSKPHHHALMLERCGFDFFRHIVWKKTGAQIPLWHNSQKSPMARYYLPNYNHEVIYLMSKGEVSRGDLTEMPDNVSMDVWDISQFSAGGKGHPAAFPVSLASAAIKVLSCSGEKIFEPFGGSGTIMIAAEKLNRVSFLMEMDPLYCDVIVKRWEKFTGQIATMV